MKRLFALVIVLAGCGGGGAGSPASPPANTQTSVPSPAPSATGSSPQLSTTNVVLQSAAAQQVAVTEPGYTGNYAESDTCNPPAGQIAVIAAVSNANGSANYSVTPINAGSCTVTISDSAGRSSSVSVSIAAAAITVQ